MRSNARFNLCGTIHRLGATKLLGEVCYCPPRIRRRLSNTEPPGCNCSHCCRNSSVIPVAVPDIEDITSVPIVDWQHSGTANLISLNASSVSFRGPSVKMISPDGHDRLRRIAPASFQSGIDCCPRSIPHLHPPGTRPTIALPVTAGHVAPHRCPSLGGVNARTAAARPPARPGPRCRAARVS